MGWRIPRPFSCVAVGILIAAELTRRVSVAASSVAADPPAAWNPGAVKAPRLAQDKTFPRIPDAARNPSNPLGPGHFPTETDTLTIQQARDAYNANRADMVAGYRLSGVPAAAEYHKWKRYNTAPYRSSTHGNWYINNYANRIGRAYGKYQDAGVMPLGAVLAKDSFAVAADGAMRVGPLFLMEKMEAGFNPDTGDWRYTMIMPDGSVYGVTKGENSANVRFCVPCHAAVGDNRDHLYFPPRGVRVNR